MSKTYIVTDIDYDTDGEEVYLPKNLTIDVPDDIEDEDEINEFIEDKITTMTGFCHNGFTKTEQVR